MSNKNITFNTDAGVPAAANLVINTGSDFSTTFTVVDTSNAAFDFTGYTAASQMSKSVAVGATLGAVGTFTVGITSALGGKINISMSEQTTRNLSEGRYVYDVNVKTGTTVNKLVNGNILVYAGISTTP
tara:strand:+ start:7817 stop:8203 length:387 start_codon:yes stop_codon:yes gene_type:complete